MENMRSAATAVDAKGSKAGVASRKSKLVMKNTSSEVLLHQGIKEGLSAVEGGLDDNF